ncbi:MAG: uroporphyrinogen-III synthase [Bacteroidaceae bacterium]|nr:uroporphyrinogen-III synthase [Bacteroidaceae bacterium]MBO4592729.1 uroporphyrinogen-III synthase [Bacteroidaceae bacterium]MBR4783108.1 uroporphyrinogen-III synthase [Bacteroidaceae bacterium]
MVKKILVSQPKPSTAKSPYLDLAKNYGVTIDFQSLIAVQRLTPKEIRAQKVDILSHTAVVFNSKQAIDHFFSLCKEMRIKLPETMKYFFISQQVSLYVQQYVQYRKRKIFFGKTGLLPDLVDVMLKHKKETYLIPQSDVHKKDISVLLDSKGINHTDCVMYRTVSAELDKSKPFDYDMIVFFTPSGAKSLVDNFPDYKQGDTVFACFGDGTAAKLEELGFRVDIKAVQGQGLSMSGEISNFLEAQKKK